MRSDDARVMLGDLPGTATNPSPKSRPATSTPRRLLRLPALRMATYEPDHKLIAKLVGQTGNVPTREDLDL
jgi:hypothetical protein